MLKQVTLSLLLVFTIMSASVVSAQTVPVSKVIPTENTSYEVPKPNDLNDTKTKGISPYSPSEKAKMPPTTTPAEGAPTPTAEVTPSSLTSDTASTDSSAATQPATTTDPSATAQETDQTTTSSATAAAAAGSTPTAQIPTLNSLSVSVQPFTGSASMPIAINVPAGRAGIQPSVALVYSSGLPESFAGVGWNLDLGSIQRSTKKGPPKYNSTDTFVLMQSGSSSDLVFDTSVIPNMYRQEIEGSFSKIVSSGSGSSMTWVMTDKKGTKYYFGQTAASRQADPANAANIFAWMLDRVEDINGNYMTITYVNDGNSLYPDTIQYTGNSNTPTIAPFAKVVFSYAIPAVPRTLMSYKTSFLVTSSKLLDTVQVYGNNNLLTKYKFNYQQSVNSKRYLLSTVVQYGADGTSALPTVTFTYQGDVKGFTGIPEKDWSVPIDGSFVAWEPSTSRWVDRGVRVADIDGDAYPDLVRHYYGCNNALSQATYLNTKQKGFQLSANWKLPANVAGFTRSCASADHSMGVQLTDVDGDMWVDGIRNYKADPTLGGALTIQSELNDKVGNFTDSVPWKSPNNTEIIDQLGLPSAEYAEYQGVIYADVNSDGFTDIVQSKFNGTRKYGVYLNQAVNGGTGWVLDAAWTATIPVDVYSAFSEGATLADLNGDGLPEISYIDGSGSKTYMNTGHGWMSGTTPWDPPPLGTARFPLGVAQFADVNGDGLADVIVGNGNYVEVMINTGSGWFDDRASWSAPSGYFARLDQRMLDANADGVVDYMYSLYGYTTEMYMNKSKPADLLVKVDNGLGATTEITYDSSAHYTNTFLPFIVQVVKSVKVSTATESYITNYSYSGGLWAADTREFRGFGQVKVTDPDGNYTLTNYLQDKIYKGMASSQETYDVNNVLFAKTVNTWNKKTLITGDVSVFPYLQRVDSYLYDGAATDRRTAQEFFYDETTQYGNMTKTIEYGEVNFSTGADSGSDKRTTESTYLNSSSLWLLGLPTQVTIKDNAGTQVRLTSFYYDNHPNLTDAPTKGQLTKRVRWNGTGNPTPTDLYSYDTVGNLLTTTDPLNNVTSITYDPWKLFPLTTTNALSQVVTTEYYGINGVSLNSGGFTGLWGQVKSVTDANNQKAYRVYDTFGRVTKTVSPLDVVSYPTTIIDYVFTSQYSSVMTRQRRNPGVTGVIDTVQFYDGLGRLIQTKTETTSATQFIIGGQTQYNSRGLALYKYVPRFTSNNLTVIDPIVTSEPKVTLAYDAMGRLTRTTNPDGTYSSTVYMGWRTEQYEERGARNDYTYDAYGRVVKVEEYGGYDGRSPVHYPAITYYVSSTTNYTYDSEGNLKTVVDIDGNTTTINYDNLGRKTSMADPDMGTWSYTYDLNGNLKTQTDAKAQVITFTYDALNRLKTKVSGTTINVTYTYDDTVNSGYSKGRLSNVTYTGGSTKFEYDLLGRETQSTKTIDGVPYIVSRVYDNLSNVTKITYPDLSNVFYQYNSVGQLQAISNNLTVMPPLVMNSLPSTIDHPLSTVATMFAKVKEAWGKLYVSWIEPEILGVKEAEAAAPSTLFVSNITYNANGQALTIAYGNGATTTQTYNSPMFRLNRIYTVKGATVLQDLNYTYDAIGNVKTIVDNKNTGARTFTYNHRNNLSTADVQNVGMLSYSYQSGIGNILSKEGINYTYSKVNAGPHAVTSLSDGTTLTYDLNGNMSTMVKTGDSKAFTYDVENRLIDVKKNSVTVGQYFYDGDGGRTRKINYASGQTGNNTCFLAGTKVLMGDGGWKNIEDIKVNDRVASYDEKKMAKTSAKVTEMFDGESAKEYLLVNGSLKVTPNHRFYSQGKWVEIGKLKKGDVLLDEKLNEVKIESIKKVKAQNSVQVYNIEVEGEHNYYANGLLVHNKLSYNPPAVSGVPVTSGVMTNYIGSLAEETKGTWVNKVFLGSMQIATVSSDAVRYYFQDHLGSANVVTDAAGSSIELMEYKPFGDFSRHNKYGGNENVAWYYFTGKPLDDETGLMFYGARYYSPILGRFITPDTIVQGPMNPQTLNRYSYCNNNPVNFVDPTGHSWKNFWKAVAVAVVGTVLTIVSAGTLAPVIGAYWAGVVTGAAAGATIGGTFSAAMGGNIGMGLLTGAVGGAVFAGLAPGLSSFTNGITRGVTLGGAAGPLTSGASMASNFAAGFLGGAASGAAVAGVSGADIGNGALIGGATAGVFSLARDAASSMRAKMVQQSRLDPRNSSGKSAGWKGDGFKLGGGRFDASDPMGVSPLGGIQGGQGTMFGFNYAPGSIPDFIVEMYAGPHDFLNSWAYNPLTGNLRNLSPIENFVGKFTNPLNVVITTPIAVTSTLPATASIAPATVYGQANGRDR